MNKIILRISLILFAMIIFTNCISFTLSTDDLPKTGKPLETEKEYESLGVVETESSSFHLLWFIPVTNRAKFDYAIEDAIETKGGDNIINLQYETNRQIWILGRVTNRIVKGEVIRYKD